MSNKLLALVMAATTVILCGIAGVAFTSHGSTRLTERAVTACEEWKARAERTLALGKEWQAVAESNGAKLCGALAALQHVEYALRTKAAKTPFQFAQDSTQDAQNIKFTINGQLVHLIGPGAQAVLEELQ